MAWWLMKTEPASYSIADLEREGVTAWEGVRNYQARNFMRCDMRVGDRVLFYHSNAAPAGVVGLARVASAPHPDMSAFNPRSPYYDPRSTHANPRWHCVDVGFEARWSRPVSLDTLRHDPALDDMLVLRKGMRLSVQPVEARHAAHILALAAGTMPCPAQDR